MQIVSKFHDYYDGCIDRSERTPVYIRKQQVSEVAVPELSKVPKLGFNQRASCVIESVWFCGKRYNSVAMFVWPDRSLEIKKYRFWDVDSLRSFIDSSSEFSVSDLFLSKFYSNSIKTFDHLTQVLNDRSVTEREMNWLIENSVTGLHLSPKSYRFRFKTVVTLEPKLGDMNFAKVLDPWQARQELEAWFNGPMVDYGKPIVKLTDQDRINKHGFDKWSFRKKSKKSS